MLRGVRDTFLNVEPPLLLTRARSGSAGEAPGGGFGGNLDAGAVAELGEYVADVSLDRAGAEVEGGADFGTGAAGRYELRDLSLAGAEETRRSSAAPRTHSQLARDRAGSIRLVRRVHVGQRQEVLVLARASDGDGVVPGEVGRSLGLSTSTMAGVSNRLEAERLIRRHPHPRDRRLVLLKATAKGRQVRARELAPFTPSWWRRRRYSILISKPPSHASWSG
jgi:DNA-binding MarR family transcriptional regulator